MPQQPDGRVASQRLKRWLALLVAVFATGAALAQPKLVITRAQLPRGLDAAERALLDQTDWVARLSMLIQKNGSARVLTRDTADLQAILAEKSLAASDLSTGDGDSFELGVADSILRPIVRRFELSTTYTPVPLVENIFARRDTVSFEYEVRVLGTDGTEKFTKAVEGRYRYPEIQETAEQRSRGRLRGADDLIRHSDEVVDKLVNAIVVRINPITVVAIRRGYFVIDRGADGGVEPGDMLQVFSENEVVVQANSGKKLRIPGEKIGDATITEVHEDVSFVKLAGGAADTEAPQVKVGYTLRFPGASQ